VSLIRKGTIVVIEEPQGVDTGTIGSNNIMRWRTKGCLGVVTNNGARDTDQIIVEKVPLYYRQAGRGVPPGRNQIESVNCSIVCGGVLVEPGDVIFADGDGVAVVPRTKAKDVADYARATVEKDKKTGKCFIKNLACPSMKRSSNRNHKYQIQNPKQITIVKNRNSKSRRSSFGILIFGFEICLGFVFCYLVSN
jgi:4-hydroxy-4-methyl-2-oxoglutarate aldolase